TTPTAASARPVDQKVNRVVIISIDGLRPDLIFRAEARNLQGLMERGTFTLWARTIEIAKTLPSHTTMLTGTLPEQHKVNWNDDRPRNERGTIQVPTLFQNAKAAGLTTAMVASKYKFEAFVDVGGVDHVV